MGLPYSKQIHSAFDKVTPLVAAGFQVLQTTKNISILLAAIQVLTVLLLCAIQVTLLALLVTVNPDVEEERQALVSPAIRWIAAWALNCSRVNLGTVALSLIVLSATGGIFFMYKNRYEIGEKYVHLLYGGMVEDDDWDGSGGGSGLQLQTEDGALEQ